MADILIRGMEMPKHCMGCPCMVDKYGGDNCCLQSEESNEKITSWDDMKAGCPLGELPPHGDLIDRDNFINNCVELAGEDEELALFTKSILSIYFDKCAPIIVPSNKEETE